MKRRRVSNEKEEIVSCASSVCSEDLSLGDLFSSLAETADEESFPTIAWDFDE